MKSRTLSLLLNEAKSLTDTGITFIEKSDQEYFLSYKELHEKALKGLSLLQDKGVQPKQELIFQIEDNETFVIVFWACILGGIVPVPLSVGQSDDHRQKLFNIWHVLTKPNLIVSKEKLAKLSTFAAQKGLEEIYFEIAGKVIHDAEILASDRDGQVYDADENDLAFVQFSSGSTGSPKGVMLTHRNLIVNLEAISRAARYTDSDSTISWMPLTHDMGLIGFHLNPLMKGMNQYLIPTSLFVRRPALWLEKANKYRATILCSPNFGYKYVLKHCNTQSNYDWDFSRVRLLYNGAEPISEKICHEFINTFSRYGLSNRSMRPVYGLAEASLAVSISELEREVISLHLDRSKLNLGDKVILRRPGDHSCACINVGEPIENCSVRITTHGNKVAEEEIIGYVQIKGANVTAGYYNNEAATKDVMGAEGWLNTGDLGFLKGGSLYIVGRAKDVFFVNGQNYYPPDLERMAEEVEGIELNKIAIVGFFNEQTQQEETMAFVLHRGNLPEFIQLAESLNALINSKIGFRLDRIIPVKDIPRTTSGKLQRFRLLEQYNSGIFDGSLQVLDALMKEPESSPPAATIPGPRGAHEQALLNIWSSIFRNAKIGVTQKFFEIGGNSLKAAELSAAMLIHFGVELPVELLYEKQTIRELADVIGSLEPQTYTPIPTCSRAHYYPAASAQQRLYYAWEADKASIAYNIPVAFRIKGLIRADQLEDGIRQIITQYYALRMSFSLMTEPVFTVDEEADFVLHCTSCHPSQLNAVLSSLVQPFDLTRGPLFRVALIETAREEYILFVDFHHIVSDGVSIRNFIEELLTLYHGGRLPSLPVAYQDYVYWEKEQLQSAGMKRQEEYWLNHLQGELPVLQMPLDFARPAVFGTQGAKLAFSLSPETTAGLFNLAHTNHCTLHVLLFAVYNVMLWKYTGQDELVVGIPASGRRHPDVHRLQGMFVNNLAIRSIVRGEESFIQFLQQEKRTVASALNNQDYPFGELVRKVSPKRDVSRNPVFDTMFIYQNLGFPTVENGGISLSRHFFDPCCAKFDLSLEVFEAGNTIECGIEYGTGLFRRETAERLAGHFRVLIEEVLRTPDRKLADLSLLTAGEYAACIRAFNASESSYPKDKTVHKLFEEQARRTPARIALDCNGATVTYQELDEQANRLALFLREKGVAPDCIVGLLLPRSPALIVGMLGILKAGGAYLPIEPGLPEERIQYLVSDSRCTAVITDASNAQRLARLSAGEPGPSLIELDKLPLEPNASIPPADAGSPGHLAYTMYTSGTSGRPKGVMIEHKALVNYVSWAAAQYVRHEEAVFPLYTSVSFDLTVTSIFTPLLTGNKIVIYGEEATDQLLARMLTDDQVDVLKLTPSHLKMLRELKGPAAPSRLKRIIVGGEQLETQLAKDIHDKFGGNLEIYNEYGPTEATVGCMIHAFDPEENLVHVPIGVPAPNTRIYLLDAFLKPVPVGVNGELYVAGDGIARGYLFQEALTQQKFIPDPFCEGQKMYKTGDIARRLPGGTIQYIGRADQQVKVNGYRIEPAEIEHHLLSHPGVAQVLVVLSTHQKLHQRLCAYYRVEPDADDSVDERTLKNHLAVRLPHYMIPAHLIRVEKIPLTRNGKVDHAALPEPATGGAGRESRLPANAIEEGLLKTWEQVLGERNLQVTDNFFELGGDSIKAVQIVSRLFAEGIVITTKDILTYHTIAQISARARIAGATSQYEQGMATGERALLPIEAWFFGQHFPHPGYYNQSVLLRLNKKVDVRLLGGALGKLIQHHDGLRINYDPARQVLFYNNRHLGAECTPAEIVLTPAAPPAGGSHPGAADQFTGFVSPFHAVKGGFDLTESLLLKAALVKASDDEELLLLTAHHLVTDGVSWRILLEDLYTCYAALEQGEAIVLPPKTATLLDWERALRAYAQSAGAAQEAHWNATARTEFSLPQDFPTNDWSAGGADRISGTLSTEDTRFLLKEANRAYKTDVPVLLNTALVLALREWTGLSRFVVEQENHGRHLEAVDTSRTVGWLTTMYPAQLEIAGDLIADQIKAVKEQLRSVPDHGIGYGIYRYFGKPPANAAPGLTQIRFNYLGQFNAELDNALFSYSGRPHGNDVHPSNRMTAKLEVNAMMIGGVLSVEFNYNRNAHQAATITRFREAFFKHLSAILAYLKEEDEIHFTPSDFGASGLNDEDLVFLFE